MLQEDYNDDGLEIIAFPCNQFGRQEPKSNAEIKKFTREKYNYSGTLMSKSDVNGDNINDVFIGSPSFQKSELFIGNENKKFTLSDQKDIYEDFLSEDVDALFFDADADNDLDLYVVSGGNEFSETQTKERDLARNRRLL